MPRNSTKQQVSIENSNGTGAGVLESPAVAPTEPSKVPSAPPIDHNATTPVTNPLADAAVVGTIHRTTTVVDRQNIVPNAPANGTPRGLRLSPEQEWPTATLLRTETEARALVDRIFNNNRTFDYNIKVTRFIPGYTELTDAPQGPTKDVDEYVKHHAGREAGAYRVSVYHISGALVAQYRLTHGNLGTQGAPIDNPLSNPEVAAKQAELKSVEIDEKIQAIKGGGNQIQLLMQQMNQQNQALLQAIAAQKTDIAPIISALAPALTAILSKPKDDGMEKMFAVLMKMQTDAMTAAREDRKFMAEVQAKQTEMMMKAIADKKSGGGEMNMMQMMQLMRDMKNDIREDFERMLPKDDDDVNIDPNNLWGSIAAEGIGGVIKAFKSGSPAAMSAIAAVLSNMGKRSPAELTDADIPALQAELQRKGYNVHIAPSAPQLPIAPAPNIPHAPVNVPARTVAAPQPVGEMPPPNFIRRTPVQPSLPSESLETPPPLADVEAAEPVPTTDEILKEDLRQELDLSIDMMIADIHAGRINRDEPTWTENAVTRWHESFLNELEMAGSPSDVMEAVKKVVGAAAWNRVDVALKEVAEKTSEAPHYQFIASFGVLIELWKATKELKKAPPAQEGAKSNG